MIPICFEFFWLRFLGRPFLEIIPVDEYSSCSTHFSIKSPKINIADFPANYGMAWWPGGPIEMGSLMDLLFNGPSDCRNLRAHTLVYMHLGPHLFGGQLLAPWHRAPGLELAHSGNIHHHIIVSVFFATLRDIFVPHSTEFHFCCVAAKQFHHELVSGGLSRCIPQDSKQVWTVGAPNRVWVLAISY